MARILVSTIPARGHVAPLVPIARRLVDDGHEVRWLTHPRYQSAAESSGAQFVEPQDSFQFSDEDVADAFPGRPRKPGLKQLKFDLTHIFVGSAPAQARDVRRVSEAFAPELVLTDAGSIGARLETERSGVPHCAIGVVPMTIGGDEVAPFGLGLPPKDNWQGRLRNRALHALVRKVLFADVQRHYDAQRASLGLGPSSTWFLDGTTDCDLYLQPTISDFEYPRRKLPDSVHFIGALPVPRPPGWTPPEWWPELDGDRPVVHVTQGTFANEAPTLIASALEALADEDVLVVVSTGGRALEGLGRLPDNARASTFLSYPDLLPKTAVMLTNGGYGGVQAALAHGVPVIVAGKTEDKAEVAARVAWSGAGLSLGTSTPRPRDVHTAVRRVLAAPHYGARARALSEAYSRHDAIGRAASLIVRAAGQT